MGKPITINPLSPPTGDVPDEATSRDGLIWLESFHQQHPQALRAYWEVTLGGSCSAETDAQAAAASSPLAYVAAQTRILPYHWKAFRLRHGMTARLRGKTRRRHGIPVDVFEDLARNGAASRPAVPPGVSLCPACSTLTVRLERDELGHIWHYLLRQGKLPLEEASNGE
jgi:hypothetical protein